MMVATKKEPNVILLQIRLMIITQVMKMSSCYITAAGPNSRSWVDVKYFCEFDS